MKSVIELQKKAIDSKIDINDLLLHAYLIACQLMDDKRKEKYSNELFGTFANEKVDSRLVSNDRIIFIDVGNREKEILRKELKELYLNISVKDLQYMLTDKSHYILSDDESNLGEIKKKYPDLSFSKIKLKISRQEITDILFHIRKDILDWTIELQLNNIFGEEGFFSNEERVSGIQMIYGDLIYGDKVKGDKQITTTKISQTVELIEKFIPEYELSIDKENELNKLLMDIKEENKSNNVDQNKIKGFFKNIGSLLKDTSNTAITAFITALVEKHL